MKIKILLAKTKYCDRQISIYGIPYNTLTLLLIHAKENLEKEIPKSEVIERVNQNLINLINKIDNFISDEKQELGAEVIIDAQ